LSCSHLRQELRANRFASWYLRLFQARPRNIGGYWQFIGRYWYLSLAMLKAALDLPALQAATTGLI
jgi:hypothetical protein